jgi:peptidoglycan/LPS O-acetylase OafA/YrhL
VTLSSKDGDSIRLTDTRALTGLRFLAAFHVLLLHELPDEIANTGPIISELLERTAAVSIFFVLSGFLMSLGRGTREWKSREWLTFLKKRVAKVMPVYYVGFLVFLPVFLMRLSRMEDANLLDGIFPALANLFHIQSFLPHFEEPWYINRPAWTIGVFMTFYLMFPYIHSWLLKKSARVVGLLFWIFFIASQVVVILLESNLDMNSTKIEILHKFPLVRIFEFLMGVTAGTWLNLRNEPLNVESKYTFPIALSTVLLFIFLPPIFSNYIHNGLLTPLFILLFLSSSHGTDRTMALLRHGPIYRMGEASYSFYILHLPLANYISLAIIFLLGDSMRFTFEFLILDILIVLPITLWFYNKFEEPMRLRILGQTSSNL